MRLILRRVTDRKMMSVNTTLHTSARVAEMDLCREGEKLMRDLRTAARNERKRAEVMNS